MKFDYNIKTRAFYSPERDEWVYDEKEKCFEPTDEELIEAIVNIITGKIDKKILGDCAHKTAKNIVNAIIKEHDLIDELAKQYESDLKEWFEDEAMEVLK